MLSESAKKAKKPLSWTDYPGAGTIPPYERPPKKTQKAKTSKEAIDEWYGKKNAKKFWNNFTIHNREWKTDKLGMRRPHRNPKIRFDQWIKCV